MKLIKNHFVTVLILVLILAACVQAHPNVGDDPFDNNMDWPWDIFSMGGQFADAIAYDQFNTQLTPPSRPVNSRSVTSPPHPTQPQSEPQLQPTQAPLANYDPAYFSFPGAGLAHSLHSQHRLSDTRSAPILTFAQEQPSTMNNNDNSSPMPQWESAHGSMRQQSQMEPGYQPAFEGGSATANAANMYGYPGAPQAQQWLPQPPTSQPAPQHGLQVYSGAQFSNEGQFPIPSMDRELNFQPPQATSSVPQILPAEVTSNPNYQPGVVPSTAGNMLGWINRAPAIGDRTLPSRLDTNMLVPPEANSANRSPTSASTTGSSARGGSRRATWEMTGDFVCHWCSAGFTTQGDLAHHLRSHQPYQSRQHVCQHCHKRFQYRKDLARHVPKHDPNRKRYYCTYRGCKYHARGFGRQDHLDRHIQTQHRIDTPQQSSRPSSNHASNS